MDQGALNGSWLEQQALAEWLASLEALRSCAHNAATPDLDSAEQVRLLTRRMTQAENRLRAIIGLPPLPL